jgi:NAD(P)H dehydrogenase (quinone)
MSIVVTGATGQLGRLVVASLLDRGVAATEIVATGRSSERLATLTELGVRTAELDYDDPDAAVFSADDVVLLVSGSEVGKRVEQHGKVIDAAAQAGVARIVYTSVAHADDTTIVVAPEHVAAEELLAASGLQHTILRNGWYSENYLPTFQQAQQGGAVLTSAGEGRVSSATRADYAEAAAVVLSTGGHENAIYELGGDKPWTMGDLASTFADVIGRPVELQAVTAAEQRSILTQAGLDEPTADFVVGLDRSTAADDLLVTTGDLSRLIGRPTTPIQDTVRTWR